MWWIELRVHLDMTVFKIMLYVIMLKFKEHITRCQTVMEWYK